LSIEFIDNKLIIGDYCFRIILTNQQINKSTIHSVSHIIPKSVKESGFFLQLWKTQILRTFIKQFMLLVKN